MTDNLPETPQAALERLLKKVRWSRKALAEGSGYSERMVHRWLEAKNPLPIPPHILGMLEVYSIVISAGDNWFTNADVKPASEFAAFLRVALETRFSPRPTIAPPPVKPPTHEVASRTADLKLLHSPSPPALPQTTNPVMLRAIEAEKRRLEAERQRAAAHVAPPPPTVPPPFVNVDQPYVRSPEDEAAVRAVKANNLAYEARRKAADRQEGFSRSAAENKES